MNRNVMMASMAAAVVLSAGAASAQVFINGTRTIFLPRQGGNTPNAVAYHPGFQRYYANQAGTPSATAAWYDINGNLLGTTSMGTDSRGWFWSQTNQRIENYRYNAQSNGVSVPNIAGNGNFLGSDSNYISNIPSNPDVQAGGDLDPVSNRLFTLRPGTNQIYTFAYPSGNFQGTFNLDLGAAGVGVNDINIYHIGFAEELGGLIIVGDKPNNRALAFRPDSGQFVGAATLDIDVSGEDYATSFTNGQVFVFDSQRNGWQGYNINGIPSPGAAALLGLGGLAAARRRR